MFPKISSSSRALSKFILALHLSLSKPQMRYTVDIVDSLMVCEPTKTLSALNRQLIKSKDVYGLSDFFTLGELRIIQKYRIRQAERKRRIFIYPEFHQ